MEEAAIPKNRSCKTPETITLTSGRATLTGNTAFASPDLTAVRCGGLRPLRGPQLYYELTVRPGKAYKLTFKPTFSASVVVFPASAGCDVLKVELACASHGASGALFSSGASPGTFVFRPRRAGAYVIAVKGAAERLKGRFTLAIEETTPP